MHMLELNIKEKGQKKYLADVNYPVEHWGATKC